MVKLNENAVREAAYYNWQNAGCPQGQDEYFWSLAVEQLSKGCNCSCSGSSKKSSTTSCKKSTSKSSTKKSK